MFGMVLLEQNWNPFLQILSPMKKSCTNIIFKEWFYIYHINCGVIQGFPAPRKAVTTHVKKCRTFLFFFFFFFFFFFTCVDIANQLLGFQQWALGMTDVTTCRRTTSECKRSCPFKKSNLPCTKACLCMADEGCCNPLNEELLSDNDSSASDTEWLFCCWCQSVNCTYLSDHYL